METVAGAMTSALHLIANGDADLYAAVATSLRVSLSATLIAALAGVPLGALLAVWRFPGRRGLLVVANAMMGLPPVVAGLVVYLMLSRSGPLGDLGLLFTIEAMITAQVLLTLPIVIALTHRTTETSWAEYGDPLRIDGAASLRSVAMLIAMNRVALLTVLLAAFGRAIAEVGAIMIVGGNIRGHTRTMTTAIALETSKGDLPVALGLGMILVALTLLVTSGVFLLERRLRN